MADELFDKCLEKLKLRIGALAVNAESVVTVVKYAMEIVELTKVKGRGQRDLAVKLIRRVVVDAPITDDKEKLLLDMVDNGVVGSTIDLVVVASKGELDINAAVGVASTCCSAFFASRR